MKLTILRPDKVLFEGEVKKVTLPGIQGEMTILKNHVPLLTFLKKGKIIIDGKKEIEIEKGILEVKKNEITILL